MHAAIYRRPLPPLAMASRCSRGLRCLGGLNRALRFSGSGLELLPLQQHGLSGGPYFAFSRAASSASKPGPMCQGGQDGAAHLQLPCQQQAGLKDSSRLLPTPPELVLLLHDNDVAAASPLAKAGTAHANADPAALRVSLGVLLAHGLSPAEARALLAKAPQLLCHPLDGPAMQAKLRYCQEVLGISPRDALLHHTGYLLVGLARVDQRVYFLERRNALHRLAGGTSCMLESTPTFCARVGASLEEYEAIVADWRRSERSQGYRL